MRGSSIQPFPDSPYNCTVLHRGKLCQIQSKWRKCIFFAFFHIHVSLNYIPLNMFCQFQCSQILSFIFWRIECEEWEHVVSMKTIRLRSEETLSGFKSYIVMGTNLSLGEEVTSRGRVCNFIVHIITNYMYILLYIE